ncbi:antibiotic ABC transporter [Pseudoruegeria sp. HB172150]|uniref:antibiotic ABC transporter n=1 Tax=Pseudoruegeria sp. HB172150 TaxID=2721164 RepID=UPI001553FA0B|nr:antibiotic ABC transporter [Pseudoruegeria sp. HB172150]
MDPFRVWRFWIDMARMGAEAQAVIGMRTLGMAGLWPVSPAETTRMVQEKADAWNEAVHAGTAAMLAAPVAAAEAAMKPYRKRTRANARRLSRRGTQRKA